MGYSVALPVAEAPDEADHYAYIVYLGENRSLPEGTTVTQGKHPPLYHAAAAGPDHLDRPRLRLPALQP